MKITRYIPSGIRSNSVKIEILTFHPIKVFLTIPGSFTEHMTLYVHTHQHILQLDVSVEKTLPVQKPYSLDDVQGDLHSRSKVQSDLESGVEVTGIARHDEEYHCIGSVGVVVVNQCTDEIYYSVVLWQCPEGEKRTEAEDIDLHV